MFWADGEVADSKQCFWASGKDPNRGRVHVLEGGGREGVGEGGREGGRKGGREGGREKSIFRRTKNDSTKELTHNWKSKKAPSDFPIQLDCIDFTPLGQSSPSRPCSRD